jgi:nucleoside-diphosphate-sugar epimerase
VAGGKQPVQPVYIGDVVKVIGQCVVARRTGKYTLAVNRVYSIRQLYTAIAGKAGKKPIFIPVPYRVVSWGIGVVEFFHLPFPVSTENLLGLKQLQPVDTSADLKTLGVTLLDLKQSIDLL